MKKLLVATDGSKIAGKAVEQAKELQRCFKSNVLLYTNLEDGGNNIPEDVSINRE